jgi:nicotinamidase-related amidase
MDLQVGISDRYGANEAFFDRVDRVQRRAHEAQLPVVIVRVAFRTGYPDVAMSNKGLSGLIGTGMLVDATGDADLHPRVKVGPEDLVVTKRRVSAFAGSDLDVVLRARGVTTLVLAGIATGGVVLSTLRQASDTDFGLVVLRDCCLDADPDIHRVLMDKVFTWQADVIDSADWQPKADWPDCSAATGSAAAEAGTRSSTSTRRLSVDASPNAVR